jgi:tagatose-1,6-bisphosphate aldolase non-catalytic subunit AgaZ/GatZ
MKRVWNYFISNLLQEEPRDDYAVMKVGPWASFQLRDTALDDDK